MTNQGHRRDGRAAAVVFYDGGCPVCLREIGWYREMRGGDQISWVDAATATLPEGWSRAALLKRFTIRRRDGAVVSGAEAFLALWRGLPALRWLGRLMDRAPFLWIAERAYRLFLWLRLLWR